MLPFIYTYYLLGFFMDRFGKEMFPELNNLIRDA
jgi:hypothetical protein